MLNDISNRERFDILVKRFCDDIGLGDQIGDIRLGRPFGANGVECRIELNTSIDDERAYVFACGGFLSDQAVADQLVADITTLTDGQCGLVQPDTDSPIYAVLPFPVAGATVETLKAHLVTALNAVGELQGDIAEEV